MNRIDKLFQQKKSGVLSIYLTAGYPDFNDTVRICEALSESGVDMIEIGFPFSDPLADGPTIQRSSEEALKKGMTLKKVFEQIDLIRKSVDLPILLMGYLNPILQYGVEAFCKECVKTGVDGCIIPDLPLQDFEENYKHLFATANLKNVLLVTPQSSDERIKELDEASSGFIYAVSSAAITGGNIKFDEARLNYLSRLVSLNLQNPVMLGFGISSKADLKQISQYVSGGIVGSAFIRALSESKDVVKTTKQFVQDLAL